MSVFFGTGFQLGVGVVILLLADLAEGLLVLIDTTLVAKGEILGEFKLCDFEIFLLLCILQAEKFFCAATLTLEALLAFPLAVWDGFKHRFKAERMESFIAFITIK